MHQVTVDWRRGTYGFGPLGRQSSKDKPLLLLSRLILLTTLSFWLSFISRCVKVVMACWRLWASLLSVSNPEVISPIMIGLRVSYPFPNTGTECGIRLDLSLNEVVCCGRIVVSALKSQLFYHIHYFIIVVTNMFASDVPTRSITCKAPQFHSLWVLILLSCSRRDLTLMSESLGTSAGPQAQPLQLSCSHSRVWI